MWWRPATLPSASFSSLSAQAGCRHPSKSVVPPDARQTWRTIGHAASVMFPIPSLTLKFSLTEQSVLRGIFLGSARRGFLQTAALVPGRFPSLSQPGRSPRTRSHKCQAGVGAAAGDGRCAKAGRVRASRWPRGCANWLPRLGCCILSPLPTAGSREHVAVTL